MNECLCLYMYACVFETTGARVKNHLIDLSHALVQRLGGGE